MVLKKLPIIVITTEEKISIFIDKLSLFTALLLVNDYVQTKTSTTFP